MSEREEQEVVSMKWTKERRRSGEQEDKKRRENEARGAQPAGEFALSLTVASAATGMSIRCRIPA